MMGRKSLTGSSYRADFHIDLTAAWTLSCMHDSKMPGRWENRLYHLNFLDEAWVLAGARHLALRE